MKNSTRAREARVGDLARAADLAVRTPALARRLFATRLRPAERRALTRLARAARRHGMRVYLVGGVVRDLLLRRPVGDLDLALDGDLRPLLDSLGGRALEHAPFGTATLQLPGGVRLDLARTRRETYPCPAALPRVIPAGLAEDLARRDVAINALAMPVGLDGAEGVIDPFGGRADLRRKRVRVLYDRSFEDDPTRALRAVRVAADLGFRIEARTERLLRSAVSAGMLDRLSSARLRAEFVRTLSSRRPSVALRLLARLDLLQSLAPDLICSRRTSQALERVPAIVERLGPSALGGSPSLWLIALALLLHLSSAATVDSVISRLQPANVEANTLRDAVDALHELPRRLAGSARLRPSLIHASCRGRSLEALLSVVAGSSSTRVRHAVSRYLTALRHVRADINGHDLLRAGVEAGPLVARGLAAALVAKLDGAARTHAEQLEAALATTRRSGSDPARAESACPEEGHHPGGGTAS